MSHFLVVFLTQTLVQQEDRIRRLILRERFGCFQSLLGLIAVNHDRSTCQQHESFSRVIGFT